MNRHFINAGALVSAIQHTAREFREAVPESTPNQAWSTGFLAALTFHQKYPDHARELLEAFATLQIAQDPVTAQMSLEATQVLCDQIEHRLHAYLHKALSIPTLD